MIEFDRSPIALLNRAIVVYKTSNAHQGLKEIDKIEDKSTLFSYLPYYTARAEFHFHNGQVDLAIKILKEALSLPM